MPEELKELIEKIQTEGVKAAEEKALAIETNALKRASEIVDKAGKEAGRIISEAGDRIKRLEEGSRNSVKQASRDAIISLKKEISSMLEKIVANHIHKALNPEDLAKILAATIKANSSEDKAKTVVTLKKEDLDKIEKALFSELAHEIKKGVTLKPAADIHGGFLISYDSGRSYFDFSEKALAEYISAQLKSGLADIVKESAAK